MAGERPFLLFVRFKDKETAAEDDAYERQLKLPGVVIPGNGDFPGLMIPVQFASHVVI